MTGIANRLVADPEHDYTYDGEGNRIERINGANSTSTTYVWDHRDRLTRVEFRNQACTLTEAVDYVYNAFDRRIRKAVDTDGDLAPDTEQRFIYDSLAKLDGPVGAEDVVLVFGSHPTIPLQRLLHGNAVDQILAVEDTTEALGPDRVRWALTDNLGSVRAVGDNDGNVDNYLTFGAFGQ